MSRHPEDIFSVPMSAGAEVDTSSDGYIAFVRMMFPRLPSRGIAAIVRHKDQPLVPRRRRPSKFLRTTA